MKFESGRVIQTSADLGNARFAAPDSLDRGLDSIVQRFQSFGWQAVRREVGGARTRGRIPLVVARPTVTSSAPVRVIFQARLGELGSKRASAAAEHSGPAFLLELARSWPVSRSQRIETICVAAGCRSSVKPLLANCSASSSVNGQTNQRSWSSSIGRESARSCSSGGDGCDRLPRLPREISGFRIARWRRTRSRHSHSHGRFRTVSKTMWRFSAASIPGQTTSSSTPVHSTAPPSFAPRLPSAGPGSIKTRGRRRKIARLPDRPRTPDRSWRRSPGRGS